MPLHHLRDVDLAAWGARVLAMIEIDSIEASTQQPADSLDQGLGQKVLNAVALNASNVDEVSTLERIPGVAKQVVDVGGGDGMFSVHHSARSRSISLSASPGRSNQYSRRSGPISNLTMRSYQSSSQ